MPTSLQNFKERFYELVLSFLWRQWSALGVAGHASTDDDWVIDPEALLLVTTTFGRRDPRLFDEVLDWLSKEGGTINLQRLKNLQSTYQIGHPLVLAAMAAVVGRRAPHGKWRSLSRELSVPPREQTDEQAHSFRKKSPVQEIPSTPEPLFHEVPVIGSPDETFLRFGWLREPVQLRGLSTAPNPHLPTNLLFKLRALFGLQARAEIMGCLLCSDAAQPSDIAELTDYFPRTVQLALNEMARSGHVLAAREVRGKYFRLRKDEWEFLVRHSGRDFPRWVNWAPLFALADGVRAKLDTPEFDSVSSAVRAIELRSVFDRTQSAFMHFVRDWQFHTSLEMTGDVFVESLFDDLKTAFRTITL